MAANTWTHPKHKAVAAIGTFCSLISLALCALGVFVLPWFSETRKHKDYALMDKDVHCNADQCVYDKDETYYEIFQDIGSKLLLASLAGNALVLVLLIFIFWPLALFASKVVDILLLICQLLSFLISPTKFTVGFMTAYFSPKINLTYTWDREHSYVMINSLPIGIVLFSYILEILAFMALTLARDKGPRGGPAYLALGDGSDEAEHPHEADTSLRRHSSYIPDNVTEHNRTLANVDVLGTA